MSSVQDKAIVDQIVANDGVYEVGGEADPPVEIILAYTNVFTDEPAGVATNYKLIYDTGELPYVLRSGAWKAAWLYWTRKDGLAE
tara:strand:- start:11886 stop:12140 length:255 start_codon:yes stop_codon:yes gene_type:complete